MLYDIFESAYFDSRIFGINGAQRSFKSHSIVFLDITYVNNNARVGIPNAKSFIRRIQFPIPRFHFLPFMSQETRYIQ